MTKEEKIKSFDPGNVGQQNGKLFGLPFDETDCPLVIIPVPWDATVSYGDGTHNGPKAILEASPQLDFYDTDNPDAWKVGFFLQPINHVIETTNESLRSKAADYIRHLEKGGNAEKFKEAVAEVNTGCSWVRNYVHDVAHQLLEQGKMVALLGGDHSTPFGLYKALGEKYPSFGILQIDAHADLRKAYEGFEYSHASIFYNTISIPQVTKLIQIGIRDQSAEEAALAESNNKIVQFTNEQIMQKVFQGKTWDSVCDDIISQLPDLVHLSFDIDGLDPRYCPNTGTPVPGGLEFDQAVYLFRKLVKSGKRIIGFDLCEVAPGENEWDANVGARLLWKLCSLTALSNNNFKK
ncbi:MAG: agmatinase family protein [Flavobacteriales bacterium]